MKFKGLVHKNITYYIRYYRLVSIAVLIMTTVIVGSLVIGDSVRTTLIKRATERLGDTETIIFSRHSFMAEELLYTSPLEHSSRGMLLTNGFISVDGALIPVYVWGTDEYSIPQGTAKINSSLAKELGTDTANELVLRLPAGGIVPSGSLFVTANYTTSLRLVNNGILSSAEGGNISLKNEQIIPFNIFVNRQELAESMKVEGKVNLILSTRKLAATDLEKVWNYTVSGLSVQQYDNFTEITSDRVFLQEELVESIRHRNNNPNRLFSYLANDIALSNTSIPYSFVTALDSYKGEVLGKEDIILSDYSANRLQAKPGDKIKVSYFTSKALKTLVEKTVELKVKKIVPLTELQCDKTLSADFPGLSDVERCTDWDSDLPINMELITEEDEKYWAQYRNTPKALIAYDAVINDWSHSYGHATAIRVADREPDLSGLRMEMCDIRFVHPRESAIYAAAHGVNFSGLFFALGFFIIISAMLLMRIPLSEMLYQRRHEINLYNALGFSRKQITQILWAESAPVVFISSAAGVAAGILYTAFIMWLLGNVWKGATHTNGFSVYPSPCTVLAGCMLGIGLSLCLLRGGIVNSLKKRQGGMEQKKRSLHTRKTVAIIFTLPVAAVIAINFTMIQSITLFVVSGIILIATASFWGDYLICRNGSPKGAGLETSRLIWGTLYANKKQAILSFFTLATGIFIVFSVGLNRKEFTDSSQLRSGTGGYALWCESTVPVYHNMGTEEGRGKLALSDLPTGSEILQCHRFSADDASCLNLNKVTSPTVLGVDMNALQSSDFMIVQSLHAHDRDNVFKEMQTSRGKVYPALVDATVLTWNLKMNLGDTLWYENDRRQTVGLQLNASLSNSIFQGHILIDQRFFREIWTETTGSEVFLLKVNDPEREAVKHLLSQALHEYGVRVSTTNERLRQFNSVTDTYLSIFLTLGGLGLLLGIMSFIIVIRKNLAARKAEIALYRTLGFTDSKIEQIIYHENLIVPLYAIATGIISALIGVSIKNVGIWVWALALLFSLCFVVCTIVFIRISVKKSIHETEHTYRGLRTK